MRPFHRFLLLTPLLGIIGAFALLPAQARTPDGRPPKVQLSLFNDAAAPPDVIAAAQSRASHVLENAGVEVEWLPCGAREKTDFTPAIPDCSSFAWPGHLSVRIVRRGTSVSDDVFGMSFLDESGEGVYATIYYGNLIRSGAHPALSDADMLGFAIVHEVGHLLLGPQSHSPHGVMKGDWKKATLLAASQGKLFFSESEASLMRTRLDDCQKRLGRKAESLARRDASLLGRRVGFPAAFF
jgi:hypothetical protein